MTARVDPNAADPHSEAERAELRQKLDGLIEQLPRDQRRAFELGVVERRPYAEIAEIYGWTVPKVKICIFRARKKLMEGLGEYR